MSSIRMNRVVPTRNACSFALWTWLEVRRITNANENVPTDSSTIPATGLICAPSFVDPRSVADPKELNTNRSVSPASNPPVTWKLTNGRRLVRGIALEKA